jgi:DEAD/DEAH box helicase domain-containing protein
LFAAFETFLERLGRAADLAGAEALLSGHTVARLAAWYGQLRPPSISTPAALPDPTGDLIIYAPQSKVGVRVRGVLHERTLLEPQLLNLQNSDVLMYRYEAAPGVHAWVPHDQIEAMGQDWQRAIWNPASNAIRELDS